MAFDPRVIPRSTEQSLADRLARLERRVAAIERSRVTVWTGSGPPTPALRSGVLYVDELNGTLWARIVSTWVQLA